MPDITFTSVDLPAPLSPTRATTSPAPTEKSTVVSACTAPKRSETPRSSRTGVDSVMSGDLSLLLADARVGAGLLVLGGADLSRRPETVLDDGVVDIVLRHRNRRQQDGRDLARAVVGLAVDGVTRGLVALQEVERQLRGGLGLRLDRLVDGHELLTGEDPLDRGQLGVLTRGRDLLGIHARGLHRGDRAAGGAVVGGVDALDLVLADGRDRLLHLGLGLVGRPVR